MQDQVHVTFSAHAGEVVILALAKMGSDHRVISLQDDLGYGPIDPVDTRLRAEFEREAFVFDVPTDVSTSVTEFWNQTITSSEHVLWFSRRSVRELTGYMEWIFRCPKPPLVVDIDKIDFGYPRGKRPPSSVGVLSPDRIVASQATRYAHRLSTSTLDSDSSAWLAQKHENSPLRILTDTGLESVSIKYFDTLILACSANDWLPSVRVVGDALTRLIEEDAYAQARDHLIIGRLRRLVLDGALEANGDVFSGLSDIYIRRPERPAPA
jgi:hypothetical protein